LSSSANEIIHWTFVAPGLTAAPPKIILVAKLVCKNGNIEPQIVD
jgi:hypothetical protein